MIDITPIESGDIGQCSTAMSEKLKDLIPAIERALTAADGNNPFATYRYDDVKRVLGSGSTNPYGFAACINRLLDDKFPETDLVARASRGNIRFERAKEK
jgi:hypothetical protein